MVNKRKRDELSDSDPDEATPGKQILPVANLPYDFDQEPQDGMQYLFLVRRDARRLPRVTRAPNPYEVFETTVTHTFMPSFTNDLPSEEWRTAFQTHFHNLRKNLTQTINVHHSGSKRRVVPEKRDRDAWWKFLIGYPESGWCSKSRSTQKKPADSMRAFAHSAAAVFSVDVIGLPEQAGEESLRFLDTSALDIPGSVSQSDTVDLAQGVEVAGAAQFPAEPSATPKEVQEDRIGQLLPPQVTPSHLQEIDHRMSIHLLMYFTHWINIHLQNLGNQSTAISVNHGQWMFALLTKVEDQLSAEEMNLLRNLARACLELIKSRKSEPAKDNALIGEASGLEDTTCISAASCWIVFTAVAGYWGQRDLWADAEAILARP